MALGKGLAWPLVRDLPEFEDHISLHFCYSVFVLVSTTPLLVLSFASVAHKIFYSFLSDDISLKYPFFHHPLFEVLENGWDAFQPEREFGRFKEISEDWRLSYINKDFSVSFQDMKFS